ncbi:MAG: hypothetical protein Ta2G_05080 [Termitinemataceae bacterium]|nr:MAG: hypothetical protein Ta2G_05080 [Termitinemataceae bacterium]
MYIVEVKLEMKLIETVRILVFSILIAAFFGGCSDGSTGDWIDGALRENEIIMVGNEITGWQFDNVQVANTDIQNYEIDGKYFGEIIVKIPNSGISFYLVSSIFHYGSSVSYEEGENLILCQSAKTDEVNKSVARTPTVLEWFPGVARQFKVTSLSGRERLYEVSVESAIVSEIEITKNPHELFYKASDTSFNTAGLVVMAHADGGGTFFLPKDEYTVSGFMAGAGGILEDGRVGQKLTVTYNADPSIITSFNIYKKTVTSCDILSFRFPKQSGVTSEVIAYIDEISDPLTPTIVVPNLEGNITSYTPLTPVISHSGASYTPSGAKNFSDGDSDGYADVTYTVTAEDGTTKTYKIKFMIPVAVLGSGAAAKYYQTLQAAVDASSGTEDKPDMITVLGDITLTAANVTSPAINIDRKHVALTTRANGAEIISATAFRGPLFKVFSSSSLTLGPSGGLTISGNSRGGAASLIIVEAGGKLNIKTGTTMTNNNASQGGAIYSSGEIVMSGGVIKSNTAVSEGKAVYIDLGGTLKMSGSANIDGGNDVYLSLPSTIEVTGTLSKSPAAKISPSGYVEGTQVISSSGPNAAVAAELLKASSAKFTVTPNGGNDWIVTTEGKLREGKSVATRQIGMELRKFLSLQDAIDDVETTSSPYTADSPAVINIISDITQNQTITITANKHIMLYNANSSTAYTIKRTGTSTKFTVENGASLSIGAASSDKLILDGGAVWNTPNNPSSRTNSGASIDAAIVIVKDGGKLFIQDGAVLQNVDTQPTIEREMGAVAVTGANAAVVMSGGTIRYNSGGYGGAVQVYEGSSFTMLGGSIMYNSGKWGGAVRVKNVGSKFIMAGGTIENNYGRSTHESDPSGAAFAIEMGAALVMSGGTIKNNTAASGNAQAMKVVNTGSTFTLSGNALVDQNNDVYIRTSENVKITVNGALSHSPAAKISPISYDTSTQVLDGTYVSSQHAKFTVTTPSDNTAWGVDINGKLMTIANHTVSFNSCTGSGVDAVTVPHGSFITEPTAPTRSGADFAGWFIDSGYTTQWNFATDTVDRDGITLYAKWTCTITFVTKYNHGAVNTSLNTTLVTPAPVTVTYNDEITIPTYMDFTTSGDSVLHTFTGWYTQEAGGGTKWSGSKTVTSSITLWAMWSNL